MKKMTFIKMTSFNGNHKELLKVFHYAEEFKVLEKESLSIFYKLSYDIQKLL